MTLLSMLCSAVLGIATLYQLVQALAYTWEIRSPYPELLEDEQLPRFAVLMPLRGADPFLSQAIEHVHDPVDEAKLKAWTERDPVECAVADSKRVAVYSQDE